MGSGALHDDWSTGDGPADGQALLRQRGLLEPHQARQSLSWPFTLPPGAGALRLRLTFSPPVVDGVRNLLTLTLFDPHGFRGAAHRHAPQQDVRVSPAGATAGFIAGPLPSGTWTISLDCHCVLASDAGGVEYDLQVTALPDAGAAPGTLAALPAGPQQANTVQPPRWLRGDLHLHSDHSDGRWTVDEIVRFALARRLDFIAVTDHNTTSAAPYLAQAVRQSGLHQDHEGIGRVPHSDWARGIHHGVGRDLIVVPGMELTTYFGHANALGVADWIDWRVAPPGDGGAQMTMASAAAEVHRKGGTFVINHPRAPGYPHCTGCLWEFDDRSAGYADVIEVWNGPWRRQNVAALELWDAWLNQGYRLPAVAGSDGHLLPRHSDSIGLTHVFAAPTAEAILTEVRAGRSYLSCGPAMMQQDPALGAPLAPAAGALGLVLSGLDGPVSVSLIAGGQRVTRRTVLADGELKLPLPADRAPWYRVELRRLDNDHLLALTNPVFRA